DTYGSDEATEGRCPFCSSDDRQRLYTVICTSPRIHLPEQIYWGHGSAYLEEARLIFDGKARNGPDGFSMSVARWAGCVAARSSEGGAAGACNRHLRLQSWREAAVSLSGIAAVAESENACFDVVAVSDVFEHIAEQLVHHKDQALRMMLTRRGFLVLAISAEAPVQVTN